MSKSSCVGLECWIVCLVFTGAIVLIAGAPDRSSCLYTLSAKTGRLRWSHCFSSEKQDNSRSLVTLKKFLYFYHPFSLDILVFLVDPYPSPLDHAYLYFLPAFLSSIAVALICLVFLSRFGCIRWGYLLYPDLHF